MASGGEPEAPSPLAPQRASEHGERWWPVALAVIVTAGLHVALPAKYRLDPAWVVPAVLLALLAAQVIGDPGRIDRQKTWLRIVTGVVTALSRWRTWSPLCTSSRTSSPATSSSPATPPGCWPPAG